MATDVRHSQGLCPSLETSKYCRKDNFSSGMLSLYLSDRFQRQKKMRSYIIIWLDQASCTTSHGLDVQWHLNRQLEFVNTFNDVHTCLNYVYSLQKKKILFITSGMIGQDIISEIHSLKKVLFIYIYCRNITKHELWAKSYEKIYGVFDDIASLIKKVKENIVSLVVDEWCAPAIRVFALDATESFWHLNTPNATKSYILYDLALSTMIQMTDTSDDKFDFLTECEAHYSGNDAKSKEVTDFYEHYDDPEKAISWYTRDSFVYRLVNKALRTRDIEVIYRYRYMITALYRHLTFLHDAYSAAEHDPKLTVYRGQIMSFEDFKKLTVDGIIATSSYFSTTQSIDVAQMYADIENAHTNEEISVIYEIIVNVTRLTKPFAKLNNDNLSQMLHEQEVLFSVGTIFKIEQIIAYEQFQKVILTNEFDDKELNSLMNKYIIQYQPIPNTILKLSRCLWDLNKIDTVERFYQHFVSQYARSNETFPIIGADIYNDLGFIYFSKCQYQMAKTLYETSASIARSHGHEYLMEKCHQMINLICSMIRQAT